MTNINIPFVKMNGAGNKIIVADLRGQDHYVSAQAAINLANENAVPFDQLMEIRTPKDPENDAGLRILNRDGTEAGACGNGMRCVVEFLHKFDGKQNYQFRTRAGQLSATYLGDGFVRVDMGEPAFGWQDIPTSEEFHDTTKIELQIGPIDDPILHSPSVASMGNPHVIFWVEEDVNNYDLHLFGPLIENHPIFEDRVNVTLAQVKSRNLIVTRTWERGTGLTLACGSGACATLVSAVRKDLADKKATVIVPGGELEIEWLENNHVMMSGPTEYEFDGRFDPQTGDWEKS